MLQTRQGYDNNCARTQNFPEHASSLLTLMVPSWDSPHPRHHARPVPHKLHALCRTHLRGRGRAAPRSGPPTHVKDCTNSTRQRRTRHLRTATARITGDATLLRSTRIRTSCRTPCSHHSSATSSSRDRNQTPAPGLPPLKTSLRGAVEPEAKPTQVHWTYVHSRPPTHHHNLSLWYLLNDTPATSTNLLTIHCREPVAGQ